MVTQAQYDELNVRVAHLEMLLSCVVSATPSALTGLSRWSAMRSHADEDAYRHPVSDQRIDLFQQEGAEMEKRVREVVRRQNNPGTPGANTTR